MHAYETVLVAAIILLSPLVATAGGAPEPEPEVTQQTGRLIELQARETTRRLIGQSVRNEQGEQIGSVDELFLDLSSGSIAYVIIALDRDDHLEDRYPIPLQFLLPDIEAPGIVFAMVEHDLLEWAPRMGDFPEETRTPAWRMEIDRFWQGSDVAAQGRFVGPGTRPLVDRRLPSAARYSEAVGAGVATGPLLETELLVGVSVKSATGEQLGTVADYVVNLGNGRVPYALVAANDARLHPVPLPLFVHDVDNDSLVFQASVEHLLNAAWIPGNGGVPEEQYGTIRDPGWEEENLQYWHEIDVRARHRYGMRIVPGLILRRETLLAHRVVNTLNQELGSVEDVIITRDGRVLYLEISFGGFLGFGENRYAVPISAVDADPYRTAIILDLPREALDELPQVVSDALPTEDAGWDAAIRSYWRNTLTDIAGEAARDTFVDVLAEQPDTGAVRARSAIGVTVVAEDGRVGEIAELLVDIEEPAIAFAVIETTAEELRENRMIVVPADRIEFEPDSGTARTDATLQELAHAPSHEAAAYPAVIYDRAWLEQARAYWRAAEPQDS